MPTILDKLRGVLRRPTNTAADFAAALADARDAEAESAAAVERQAAVVQANFLDPDSKRERDRVELERLRIAASDAAAIREELERRHAAAVASDEQDRRRARYDGARAQADAAALALAKTYPKLAAGMVAMLKDLATAQQAVAEANAALPDGAEPIADPEVSARGAPGLPREIVSDEWIEAWGRYDLDVPVKDRFQAEIYACGNGWGKRGEYERGSASQGEPQAIYRLRRFRKITYREPTPGDWPLPLAAAIQLPAVRGSGVLWGEAFPAHNPALAAAVMGHADPGNVLTRVAELEAAAVAKPVKAERPLKVEWAGFAEVVPLPAERIDPDRSRRGDAAPAAGSRFGASPFQRAGARAGTRR